MEEMCSHYLESTPDLEFSTVLVLRITSKCLQIHKVVSNFDLTMARRHGNSQCKSRSVSLLQFYNPSLFLKDPKIY